MYFSKSNLNHSVLTQPSKKELARDDGLYRILFEGETTPAYMSPIDYRGLLIAQRLRNAGMPTDLLMDLERFISEYTSDAVGEAIAEIEAGESL